MRQVPSAVAGDKREKSSTANEHLLEGQQHVRYCSMKMGTRSCVDSIQERSSDTGKDQKGIQRVPFLVNYEDGNAVGPLPHACAARRTCSRT